MSGAEAPAPDVGLYFPIDVRTLLGAHPRTVANCLGNASAVLKLSAVRQASVTELALRTRAVVSAYGKEQLLEDIQWAVLPAFHNTILPSFEEGRMRHAVRVSVWREHFRVLARHLDGWPHLQEASRLDTGERLRRRAPSAHAGSGPGGLRDRGL